MQPTNAQMNSLKKLLKGKIDPLETVHNLLNPPERKIISYQLLKHAIID